MAAAGPGQAQSSVPLNPGPRSNEGDGARGVCVCEREQQSPRRESCANERGASVFSFFLSIQFRRDDDTHSLRPLLLLFSFFLLHNLNKHSASSSNDDGPHALIAGEQRPQSRWSGGNWPEFDASFASKSEQAAGAALVHSSTSSAASAHLLLLPGPRARERPRGAAQPACQVRGEIRSPASDAHGCAGCCCCCSFGCCCSSSGASRGARQHQRRSSSSSFFSAAAAAAPCSTSVADLPAPSGSGGTLGRFQSRRSEPQCLFFSCSSGNKTGRKAQLPARGRALSARAAAKAAASAPVAPGARPLDGGGDALRSLALGPRGDRCPGCSSCCCRGKERGNAAARNDNHNSSAFLFHFPRLGLLRRRSPRRGRGGRCRLRGDQWKRNRKRNLHLHFSAPAPPVQGGRRGYPELAALRGPRGGDGGLPGFPGLRLLPAPGSGAGAPGSGSGAGQGRQSKLQGRGGRGRVSAGQRGRGGERAREGGGPRRRRGRQGGGC